MTDGARRMDGFLTYGKAATSCSPETVSLPDGEREEQTILIIGDTDDASSDLSANAWERSALGRVAFLRSLYQR